MKIVGVSLERLVGCRSREELVAAVRAGGVPKWLMFWGHQPLKNGGVGPGCLSQWWPAPFVVDGTTYGSAEHWMMAGKARIFGDEETRGRILSARSPAEAKKLGRLVRGFDEQVWAGERFELVVEGNVAKFGQHPELQAYLLGTKQRVLVEASPVDRVWGIGLASTDDRATDPERWRGLNLLGFAFDGGQVTVGARVDRCERVGMVVWATHSELRPCLTS
ncbi:NADAR family protein [Nocardia thailandica]